MQMAGPGCLVRYDNVYLQFDAGRATVLRLSEVNVSVRQIAAVFLTHVHSDHTSGLPDMARGARLGQAARMEGGPTHGCSEMVAREAEGTAGRGRYASCLIRQSASICEQRRPPFRLEKRSGAAAAWWSHNPQVGGSTPPSATLRRAREPAGPHARLTCTHPTHREVNEGC